MPGKIHFLVGDAKQPLGLGHKIIVHVCNDIGGWGRGFVVALSSRWKEPEINYRAWRQGKTDTPFELGQVQFVSVAADIVVANLIGQRAIKRSKEQSNGSVPPIRYEAVRKGLRSVALHANQLQSSVHMPRIDVDLPVATGKRFKKSWKKNYQPRTLRCLFTIPPKFENKSGKSEH